MVHTLNFFFSKITQSLINNGSTLPRGSDSPMNVRCTIVGKFKLDFQEINLGVAGVNP